jgi:hypothetical protein
MNLLIDKLPTDYEGLKIDTNFRSFILFELLMQDSSLKKEEKIMLALNLFFKDEEFENVDEIKKAIKAILWFYTLGKSEDKKEIKRKEKTVEKKQKAIYSFEYDSNLIYSAFLSQYRLDLNEIDYLHWWKFRSLFEGLNEENRICEIMEYRAVDLSKIKDKDQKEHYKKLKIKYALPDNRTEEEKEQDFANALW